MQEFSFWPTTPPRQLGGVFELRSYTLHPGNLLEWEHHWRKGLQARREVMDGVGACEFARVSRSKRPLTALRVRADRRAERRPPSLAVPGSRGEKDEEGAKLECVWVSTTVLCQ